MIEPQCPETADLDRRIRRAAKRNGSTMEDLRKLSMWQHRRGSSLARIGSLQSSLARLILDGDVALPRLVRFAIAIEQLRLSLIDMAFVNAGGRIPRHLS